MTEPESEPDSPSLSPVPPSPSSDPAPDPVPTDEDDELLPDERRGLFVRLVPPGSGRRLGLARALVVGAGLGALGLLVPLLVAAFATAPRAADVAGAALLGVGSLAFLGACGGAASGFAERRLAARPFARWTLLTLAPGTLTWLVVLQLVYAVGTQRAGVQAGYERLGGFLDPTSRDAIYSMTFAVGSGVGLGLVLAQLVHRRLGGLDLRAQLRGALGVIVRALLGVGCGGFCLLCIVAAFIQGLGSDEKLQGNTGQGLIALWMSSLLSLLTLGVVTALAGPWLLRVADRLEARWAPTTGAPRP